MTTQKALINPSFEELQKAGLAKKDYFSVVFYNVEKGTLEIISGTPEVDDAISSAKQIRRTTDDYCTAIVFENLNYEALPEDDDEWEYYMFVDNSTCTRYACEVPYEIDDNPSFVDGDLRTRAFMEKHTANTKYGKKIMRSESERLAHFIADRAARYSLEGDEIEARLDCFFPDEFINRVCVLTQQIYETLEDGRTEQ